MAAAKHVNRIPCPRSKCAEHWAEGCQAHVRTGMGEDGKPTYRQCELPTVIGAGACHLHGGKGGRPVTTGRNTKLGKLLRIPERYREGYERLLKDPNLHSLDDNLSVAYQRLDELYAGLAEEGDPKAWEKMADLMTRLKRTTDPSRMVTILEEADAVAQRESTRQGHWEEIRALWEQIRRMTESETRRRVQMENTMTIQEARAWMAMVFDAAKRTITLPADQKRFYLELSMLMGVERAIQESRAGRAGAVEGEVVKVLTGE